MVGFDRGEETMRRLDGNVVPTINANLSTKSDLSSAKTQEANLGVSFIGVSMHGPFDLHEREALTLLNADGNPTGRTNSDVVRPILNAFEISKRAELRWIIAFDPRESIEMAALYEKPFLKVAEIVKPVRNQNNRSTYRQRWWVHGEPRPAMLAALRDLPRFIATPRVSKHRIFVWMTPERLPSDATVAFARTDEYFFGLLHSRFHELWARATGTQLREKESGFRYTPTSCFETFPLPFAMPSQESAVAAAAKDLDTLRERWLNPPEWTQIHILTFPGTVGGPWLRFVRDPDAHGIGTVHYPRTEPRDADCAAKLSKRTLTNLYNEHPAWLSNAHAKLDAAVAAAYGWPADLSEDEILSRLLALNLERAAAERSATAKASLTKRAARAKGEDEMI